MKTLKIFLLITLLAGSLSACGSSSSTPEEDLTIAPETDDIYNFNAVLEKGIKELDKVE